VIGRVWNASATPNGADAYRFHFEESVVPSLSAVDGFLGAYLLRRNEGETTELQVVTLWDSLDAISAFAGMNTDKAVVAPEAQAVLKTYDGEVRHYEVVVNTVSR
jgi:heme-degrading monooxygenase HmoA